MAIHAEELRRYLAQATGRPIDLRMNNNLHSLISARADGAGPGIRISLHRMFLGAEPEVIEALARFVHKSTPDARRIIREFINHHRELIASARSVSAPRRAVIGSARGKLHNLHERAAKLNESHFRGALSYAIIWGRPVRGGKSQRHVTLGTWNDRQRVIRIHPMLDLPNVPTFFLDYIIYHEMVHIAVPSRVEEESGRLYHHTPEFYALETSYPRYAEARQWELRWLPRLIRAWNGGPPLPAKAAAGDQEPPTSEKPEGEQLKFL